MLRDGRLVLCVVIQGFSVMYDADKMLIYRRDGFPNGIDRVVDSYEFKPDARNGQVRKVIVIYQPGRGYRTVVHINGKKSLVRDYPSGRWGSAKDNLDEVLDQHQCDLFAIRDPKQAAADSNAGLP